MRVVRWYSRLPALCFLLFGAISASAGTVLVGYGQRDYNVFGDGYLSPVYAEKAVATGVASAACGWDHTLFVKTDGTLWAMGQNASGQLGDGTRTHRATPVQVATNVVTASAGSAASMFVKADGTLWSMGWNNRGSLGIGSPSSAVYQTTPVQIASDVVAVSSGIYHTISLKADGTLWGFGSSSNGQLGMGGTAPQYSPALIATGVARIATGPSHSLFITTTGDLYGMGQNGFGQLGLGHVTDQLAPAFITSGVTSASVGGNHSLFVKSDGTLWGMGLNYAGQLGDGTTTTRLTPVLIASDVATCAGNRSDSSMFVTTTGELRGMGLGSQGQLALGVSSSPKVPTLAATGVATTGGALAMGWSHSAFVGADGTLWTSGNGEFGQLGDGIMGCAPNGVQIAHDVTFAAAAFWRTLWGRSDAALWGVGTHVGSQGSPPAQIAMGVLCAAGSSNHYVYATMAGDLYARGNNTYGQFGDGTTTTNYSTSAPIPVGIHNVRAVAVGSNFTVYINSSDELWGMGYNSNGQLGDGSTTNRSSPVKIASDVAAVAVSAAHTVFIKKDGTLWGCGKNSTYELGTGTGASAAVTTPIQIATGVISAAAGQGWTAFVKTDGTLWGNGLNGSGQLALGSTSSKTTPTKSTLISGVVQIAAGDFHLVIRRSDNTVWTCGSNVYGQLGDPSFESRSIPAQIAANATLVAASDSNTLVVFTPPVPAIIDAPDAVIALAGAPAELSVAVSGYAPLSYQWYRGSSGDTAQPVAGANTANFNTTVGLSDLYWVRVTGPGGSTDSVAVRIGEPQSAAEWARAFGILSGSTDADMDPDQDGSTTLLEYACRTSPTSAASRAEPVVSLDSSGGGTALVMTHRRNKAANVAFSYETSSDLLAWSPAAPTLTVLSSDADGDGMTEIVQAVFAPVIPGGKQFARLQVTAP